MDVVAFEPMLSGRQAEAIKLNHRNRSSFYFNSTMEFLFFDGAHYLFIKQRQGGVDYDLTLAHSKPETIAEPVTLGLEDFRELIGMVNAYNKKRDQQFAAAKLVAGCCRLVADATTPPLDPPCLAV